MIDLKRTKARGVEGLKHFLEYAEQQVLVDSALSYRPDSENVISEQIAGALRQRGYKVDTNVGRSNFKVDVAISDGSQEGNYLLGILLDGKEYRDTQTTRDREIVQPAVLSGLNWKIRRVWSVDWLTNPERVISRIEEAVREALEEARNETGKETSFEISEEEIARPEVVGPVTVTHRDIFEIPAAEIDETILGVLQEQLSIPSDALTLLVAKKLGFARRGRNVDQALQDALSRLFASKRIVENNGMLRLP